MKCFLFCLFIIACGRSASLQKSTIGRFKELVHRNVRHSATWLVSVKSSFRKNRHLSFPRGLTAPPSWDWREIGAVTPVKSQGAKCPYSSWAFAVVGAVEAQHQLYSRKLVDLSVQQVLECAQTTQNGCDGGLVDDALEYIVKQGGLEAEESYPFIGRSNATCHFESKKIEARISGYHILLDVSELEMKMIVSHLGPVAVTIDGSQPSFRSYTGGVYNEPRCGSTLGHSMLLVGYGTDEKEGDYWLLKNSFGRTWGESGYIRMARNRGDPCCVVCYGMIPYVPM